MITGYARWLSALLIPTQRAENMFASWWAHLQQLEVVPRVTVRSRGRPVTGYAHLPRGSAGSSQGRGRLRRREAIITARAAGPPAGHEQPQELGEHCLYDRVASGLGPWVVLSAAAHTTHAISKAAMSHVELELTSDR